MSGTIAFQTILYCINCIICVLKKNKRSCILTHWRHHHWIPSDTYGVRILHQTLAHGCSLPTMRWLSRKVFQTHKRCSTYLLRGAIGQTCRSDSTNVALSGWWNEAAVWYKSSRDYTSNPNKFIQSKKMLRLFTWGKHSTSKWKIE